MYAQVHYMSGNVKYRKEKKRRNIWIVPVFFSTFFILSAVFILLGYYAGGRFFMQGPQPQGEAVMAGNMKPQPTPEGMSQPSPVPEETASPTPAPSPTNSPKPIETEVPVILPEPTIAPTPEPSKTMYLTFDDGPSKEYTNTILDVLAKYDIKATFFLIGENVEKHPEVARRIAEEGHTIGIHCYSHAYNAIYDSVDSYVADFQKAYEVIYETTGVEVEIFRFPGGSVNGYNKHICKDIVTEMTEQGYVYFDWNASLEDSVKKVTPEELVKNAKETVMDRERVIMLAHDTIYDTSLCIEDIILQFPDYKMEPLTAEVVPIRFRMK